MSASRWTSDLMMGKPTAKPVRLQNFVDGRFVSGGKAFPKFSPVTGELIIEVEEADEAIVDAAVVAAQHALEGPWGALSVPQRSAMLHAVADGFVKRFDDLVAAEVADTGKTISQARTLDIPRAELNFRAFADLVGTVSMESFQTVTANGERALNYAVRKPVGVVAVIVPWNLPLLLATWKLAPALACGNTIVMKPSEETPSSATVVAEVFAEVGVPDGVFNLIQGFGPGSAGEFLTRHPGVDAITFTGESATGSAIMKVAAEGVKAVSFELGGKNAGLVFADADLDAAVEGSLRSTFTNGGQVCLCTERLYVERPVFEEFVERMTKRAQVRTFGWPTDHDVEMMPMISSGHRDKVLGYFDLAREEGAEVRTGGGRPSFGDLRDGGAYVEPTVLTGLGPDARTNREEIFGPVCHIAPFDTEDEALALANDSAYGLAATVWTRDLSRGHRVAPALDAGLVWVNTWYLRDLRTPFGGVKASGIGREGGVHSLAFYSETANVCIQI